MKKNYPETREEYASFFERILSKESSELRDGDYTNLRTNLLAGLKEHIIDMKLVRDVAELVKLPLGTTNYKKEIDKILVNVVKNIREREQKGPEGSKFGLNMVAPAAPRPPVGKVKMSSLKKSWAGRQMKLYGEGLPEDGFEGEGYQQRGSLYVKGIGKDRGKSYKPKPDDLLEKRDKGRRNTWRSNVLIE